MSGRVELTELADQDIFEISLYIGQNRGIEAAQRFIDTITEKFEFLASSPKLGRSRYELAPELRSFPFGKYIIFYRSFESGILIIRVLHGARDIINIFEADRDA